MIFEHTDSVKVGHVYLEGVDAIVDNIDLKVVPVNVNPGKRANNIETDLVLDPEGNLVVLDLTNLEFRGSAEMIMSENQNQVNPKKERFEIEAPFRSATIVLAFSQT